MTSSSRAGPVEQVELGGGVHLHRGVALRHPGPDAGHDVGGPVPAYPGVDAHPVPHGPAQELVGRQAVPVPLDVPECLLDRCRGGRQYRPVAEEAAAAHSLPQVLDAVRVRAGDVAGQVVHGAQDRACALGHDRLAPAGQAVVGGDFDEDPPRRDPVRSDARDLAHCGKARPVSASNRWRRAGSVVRAIFWSRVMWSSRGRRTVMVVSSPVLTRMCWSAPRGSTTSTVPSIRQLACSRPAAETGSRCSGRMPATRRLVPAGRAAACPGVSCSRTPALCHWVRLAGCLHQARAGRGGR